jgi:hypothetical protein
MGIGYHIYIDEAVASMPQIEGTRWRAARSFASTPAGPCCSISCNGSELPPLPDQHGSIFSDSGELHERSTIHPDWPPRSSISCWQCAAIGYEANPAASHDAQSLLATSPPQLRQHTKRRDQDLSCVRKRNERPSFFFLFFSPFFKRFSQICP